MLKLYFSKGSSALAAHILLEEVGAEYEAIEVSIPNGEHRKPQFLERNPKGRTPVLETPDGVITENPAILEFIAEAHPRTGCLPLGAFALAQARTLSAYLCATVHVAFAHNRRGKRWVDDEASLRDMQRVAPRNLTACAEHLEKDVALSPWAMGSSYTYCDPYLFLLGRWLATAGVSLGATPRLAAHRDAMLARPATQKALAQHGLA